MKLNPLQDRMVVKRVDPEDVTPGGIIIPDNAKEKPLEGIVMDIGKGRILENGTRLTPDVKKGDRVLFNKYAGQDIRIDGEPYLILKEEDCIGVLEDDRTSK